MSQSSTNWIYKEDFRDLADGETLTAESCDFGISFSKIDLAGVAGVAVKWTKEQLLFILKGDRKKTLKSI
jgi:hypothetical protein